MVMKCENCGEKIRPAEKQDGYPSIYEWVHDSGTGIGELNCDWQPIARKSD